jgi:hypothetical protein
MALFPIDLLPLVVRRSTSTVAADGASEGAGEAIGEGATNAILKKHPLSKGAVIAIIVAIVITLLVGIPLCLCCRKRRARSEKEMGRYQQMKSERDGAHEEEARGLVE